MQYRKAASKDAKGIANVLVKSYNIKTIKEGINVFKEEAKKKYNYVLAVDTGKIVGLVTWQIHGLPKHELCELDRIAVLPEYRGKGIARGLINELITNANKEYKKNGYKLRKLYVLTHASNKVAQRFYEKMGFKIEAVLKSHFYKNENEFVYSRFF